ncbi:MAG: cytochrome c oxidase subunit II [Pseudomonadota bacterium]|nr:cytochrome c oxidase subunit II [Pseudomonadota bacterium]MDE3037387.1 cytochrome c oxidase subunit II [Pseudomonadota bacterium]
MKKPLFLSVFLAAALAAARAFADAAYVGMAKPWQIGFQPPVTPVMERLYAIHNYFLLPLITVITVFVLVVMVYICLRFNRKRNPVPSKTTHNTRLEIIWTAIPILILVVIAVPSLRIHYFMERIVNPDLTIKVTGYQWYWHYDYPDNGGFGYDSYILKDSDLKPGDIRQLSVDNPMVVPVGTRVRLLITGADVIHSWSVPSFGVKRDAIPGRLNDSWFEVDRVGTFYGQCSQLCGVGHGFMPIEVKVVSREDFAKWAKQHAPAAAPAGGETNQKPNKKQDTP